MTIVILMISRDLMPMKSLKDFESIPGKFVAILQSGRLKP